jgi:galactitol-specific phosphotransferase system IIB component
MSSTSTPSGGSNGSSHAIAIEVAELVDEAAVAVRVDAVAELRGTGPGCGLDIVAVAAIAESALEAVAVAIDVHTVGLAVAVGE